MAGGRHDDLLELAGGLPVGGDGRACEAGGGERKAQSGLAVAVMLRHGWFSGAWRHPCIS